MTTKSSKPRAGSRFIDTFRESPLAGLTPWIVMALLSGAGPGVAGDFTSAEDIEFRHAEEIACLIPHHFAMLEMPSGDTTHSTAWPPSRVLSNPSHFILSFYELFLSRSVGWAHRGGHRRSSWNWL